MCMAQVFQVHRVLCRLLRMAPEPVGMGPEPGPLGSGIRFVRQLPLRRPAGRAPPGEHHAEDLASLVDPELCGLRRWRIRRGDAVASGVEFKPVKWTDQAPVAHDAADRRPHVRSEMRTERVHNSDAAVFAAPRDDLFSEPALLDEFLAENGLARGHEIPPFGKWRQRVDTARDLSASLSGHGVDPVSFPRGCDLTWPPRSRGGRRAARRCESCHPVYRRHPPEQPAGRDVPGLRRTRETNRTGIPLGWLPAPRW